MLVRDFGRRVEATLNKSLSMPLGPLEIEAKAMEEGVQFA